MSDEQAISRARSPACQLVLWILLQVISLIVGLMVIAIGVLRFVNLPALGYNIQWTVNSIPMMISTAYIVLFGVLIVLFTLFFPRFLLAIFGFYGTYIGRGFFFIFIAGLIISNAWLDIVLAIVIFILGILFIIFFFIPIFPACKPLIPLGYVNPAQAHASAKAEDN